jgi:hypothetical protein
MQTTTLTCHLSVDPPPDFIQLQPLRPGGTS